MSLADELLADLEEIAEEGEEEEVNDGDLNDEIEDIDDMEIETKMDSVRNIAKLRHSAEVRLAVSTCRWLHHIVTYKVCGLYITM